MNHPNHQYYIIKMFKKYDNVFVLHQDHKCSRNMTMFLFYIKITNATIYPTGKYRLVRRIGSGSFGDVYLGTNILTGEEVRYKTYFEGFGSAKFENSILK